MLRRAMVRHVSGKMLVGSARGRSVVMDRPVEEGGADNGFMSGELLLLAIGSCATGSLRRTLAALGLPADGISVDVEQHESDAEGQPGPISITLSIARPRESDLAIVVAEGALSGGVSSRIRRGSPLLVRFADDEPEI